LQPVRHSNRAWQCGSLKLPDALMYHRTEIGGVPCVIDVISVSREKPQGRGAASDWDCAGHIEIEWEVLDTRYRDAPWLADKLTDADRARIEREILKGMT